MGGGDLPSDYRPSEAEPFMNERQRAYFRKKLLAWRDEILRESKETLDYLQYSEQHPDINDRASYESDRGIELRARDRQRKLIAKIEAALVRIEDGRRRELVARIKAVLRRRSLEPKGRSEATAAIVAFEGFELDLVRRRLRAPDGAVIVLSANEFAILSIFLRHAGQVLSREELARMDATEQSADLDRAIDMLITAAPKASRAHHERPHLHLARTRLLADCGGGRRRPSPAHGFRRLGPGLVNAKRAVAAGPSLRTQVLALAVASLFVSVALAIAILVAAPPPKPSPVSLQEVARAFKGGSLETAWGMRLVRTTGRIDDFPQAPPCRPCAGSGPPWPLWWAFQPHAYS